MVVNFRRSVIIEELWRPEVARPGNYVSNFCVFFGKTTPYGKILKNVKQVFTASPIDDVVFICHKIYPTAKCAKSCCLSNCRYCADRAQNLPGPAPNNMLTVLQISSKSVHFRRSYSRTREHRFCPV